MQGRVLHSHATTSHIYLSADTNVDDVQSASNPSSIHPQVKQGNKIELNLVALLNFHHKKKKATFNIAQQVGRSYTKLGTYLLEDNDGAIMPALEDEYSRNAERINTAIFTRWLQGSGKKPVSWSTLIDGMRFASLNTLAEELLSEI